jgi:large subunit ribosomal protein L24
MAAAQPRRKATKVPEIRRGDTVVVLTGKDKGAEGEVIRVLPKENKVIVAGVNIAKRHTKPRQSSSTTDRTPKITQGGILDLAQPMSIGKVMVVCGHCDKPTRIAHRTLDNGRRVRVCRHCGEQLETKS